MLPVMIAQYNQPLPIKKVTPSNMGDSPWICAVCIPICKQFLSRIHIYVFSA